MYTKAVIKGRDRVLKDLEQMSNNSKSYIVTVGVGPTQPIDHPKHRIEKPRSAGENIRILNANAKKGRKIDFFSKDEVNKLSDIWKTAINKQLKTKQNEVSKASKFIGSGMVNVFKNHITKGVSKKGSMKPLTKLYSILKNTRYGGGKPILVATGQLLNSFIFEVRKL